MKEIFLSFKPVYFKAVLYGLKKYEYRNRFCAEPTKAYLYLSGNKRMVIGIMELDTPIRLDKTINDYQEYPDTLKRVKEYVESGTLNAVPIKSLTLFESPLYLEEIREEINGFMPPQMYYVLDNHPKLKSILYKKVLKEPEFTHKHDKIYYDNLALSVSEIKKTEKYQQIDDIISYMNDYKDIL